MDLWRICRAKHASTAFAGSGAEKVGGRWNPKGCRMVYTSESPAVATLELFVHVAPDLLPPMVLTHARLDVDEWYQARWASGSGRPRADVPAATSLLLTGDILSSHHLPVIC